jgi:hypothetical protein
VWCYPWIEANTTLLAKPLYLILGGLYTPYTIHSNHSLKVSDTYQTPWTKNFVTALSSKLHFLFLLGKTPTYHHFDYYKALWKQLDSSEAKKIISKEPCTHHLMTEAATTCHIMFLLRCVLFWLWSDMEADVLRCGWLCVGCISSSDVSCTYQSFIILYFITCCCQTP